MAAEFWANEMAAKGVDISAHRVPIPGVEKR